MSSQMLKYAFTEFQQEFEMPSWAGIMSVQGQGDQVTMWTMANVDPASAREVRVFQLVGTGQDIPPECDTYVGTALVNNGVLVWHVFERSSERRPL